MKKLWIVLLSAALVMSFAFSATAADVKFSGSYYVEGVFRSNPLGLDKEDSVKNGTFGTYLKASSQALYFQRLRVQTEFQVVEGLKLVTRFDALEKRWGDQTMAQTTSAYPYDVTNRTMGTSASRIQENLEFERAYVDFNTGIGRFLVGYQEFGTFGTVFLDTSFTKPGLKYFIPIGPVTLFVAYDKQKEWEVTAAGTYNGLNSDLDKDEYYIGAIYKQGNIEAGAQIEYLRSANGRVGTATTFTTAITNSAYTTSLWLLDPYFKGKFGPVFVEAEFFYGNGKMFKLENTVTNGSDVDVNAYGFYLHARADISMFYFGGYFTMVSGDDPATPDKIEGGLTSATVFQMGQNWSPTLIFKNDDHATYTGGVTGGLYSAGSFGGVSPLAGIGGANTTNQFMDNIWFFQLYFGVKPTPKFDIGAKISYAWADKKPWATPSTLGLQGSIGNAIT